jgi:TolB-like protein
MKFQNLSLLLGITLSGCVNAPNEGYLTADSGTDSMFYQESGQANIVQQQDQPAMSQLEASAKFQDQFKQQLQAQNSGSNYSNMNNIDPKNYNINHYVRGMMQDLVSNLQYVNAETPMAVTSFVFLDSNFEEADILGNQIAESFIHEIHRFGIPVIDFKTTDYVRVTPTGDFVLSRDFLELPSNLPVQYVLLGTLTKHQNGVLVNARIVGITSKAVVGSAQGFLPANITQSISTSGQKDGIKLVSSK